jgi:hypothetical protein
MAQHKIFFILQNAKRYKKCPQCEMPNLPLNKTCVTCSHDISNEKLASNNDFQQLKEIKDQTELLTV